MKGSRDLRAFKRGVRLESVPISDGGSGRGIRWKLGPLRDGGDGGTGEGGR